MSDKIKTLLGQEILDSRGNPTLKVSVVLQSGIQAFASVPSGASTGEAEAHELRDKDPGRYGGKGVRKAIENLGVIAKAICGMDPTQQAAIDEVLIAQDGTENKSKLGANAIVGVSMAVARAGAAASRLPLYAYLGGSGACRLPAPMMNVVNGGAHAENSLDFQEFMIVPHGAPSFREALRWGAESYHALKRLMKSRGLATAVGDEGGFAPDLGGNEEACELIVEAVREAGYAPGGEIALALDPAASAFWDEDGYELRKSSAGRLTAQNLNSLYSKWCDKYPIASIEDGFGEKDWRGFRDHTTALGGRIQIVGDDIYATNKRLIERGVTEGSTNAVLIKLNQIGTVTETIAAIETCRAAGWRYIVSHRSGETDDPFIADFAVAMGGGQIKAGAPCRGERVAKYNRLLEIETELGERAEYKTPFPNWRWEPSGAPVSPVNS